MPAHFQTNDQLRASQANLCLLSVTRLIPQPGRSFLKDAFTYQEHKNNLFARHARGREGVGVGVGGGTKSQGSGDSSVTLFTSWRANWEWQGVSNAESAKVFRAICTLEPLNGTQWAGWLVTLRRPSLPPLVQSVRNGLPAWTNSRLKSGIRVSFEWKRSNYSGAMVLGWFCF